MNTLFLRLEGPLQSWGLRARWSQRDTASAPTKSGLVGLLGAALGLHRTDPQLRQLSDALRMGVRIDLPGTLLRDYHTVGGGRYGAAVHSGGSRFHDDPYVGGVLSAELSKGRIKVKINPNTKLPETDTSDRFYLADASFLAALQSDPATITRLAQALQTPVWPLFLGRKSCPPALPLPSGTGQYDDLYPALTSQPLPKRLQELWQRSGQAPQVRLLLESRPGAGVRQNDAIGAPARRVFLARVVEERWWTPAQPSTGPDQDTEPQIDTMEG